MMQITTISLIVLAVTLRSSALDTPFPPGSGSHGTAIAPSACPCEESWMCDPVNVTHAKEVFVFHVIRPNQPTIYQHFNWTRLTTISLAGNASLVDPQLICYAHQRNVRVTLLVSFPQDQLPNATARTAWVQQQLSTTQAMFVDGLDMDIENDMKYADELTQLIVETKQTFSSWNNNTQISFAIGTYEAPGYNFQQMAPHLDLMFAMAYDMVSRTTASSNDPLPTVSSKLDDLMNKYGIPASKLILGSPWYGYDFPCTSLKNHTCPYVRPDPAWLITTTYADAMQRVSTYNATGPFTDPSGSQSVFYEYTKDSVQHQMWVDGPPQIALRSQLARTKGLKGVGTWYVGCMDYTKGLVGDAANMWQAMNSFVDQP
eukprot:m.363075 g.363075  ORF g.363075 m.363075 type:complete len:373 (+) comp21421_c0_seq1:92-1210(+)